MKKTQAEILSLIPQFNAQFRSWMALDDVLFVPTSINPAKLDHSLVIERSCNGRFIDCLKEACNYADGSNHFLCTSNELISLAYIKGEALLQSFLAGLDCIMRGIDDAKPLSLRAIGPKTPEKCELYYVQELFCSADTSAPLGWYYDWTMHTKTLLNKYARRFEIKTE